MNIKAYSFEQNSHTFADLKRAVADSVTLGAVYFESFSDPKALFSDMSEHIDNTDVILIGVEPKVYFKFKSIFIILGFIFHNNNPFAYTQHYGLGI